MTQLQQIHVSTKLTDLISKKLLNNCLKLTDLLSKTIAIYYFLKFVVNAIALTQVPEFKHELTRNKKEKCIIIKNFR